MLMETVFRGAGKCDFDSVALILEFKFAPDGPFYAGRLHSFVETPFFSDGGMTDDDSGATFLIRPPEGCGDYVVEIAHDFNTSPPGVKMALQLAEQKSQKRLHQPTTCEKTRWDQSVNAID
jgi:hypothetical protein